MIFLDLPIWIVASTYHLLCAWQGLVWRVMGWACGGLTPTLAGMRCLSTRRNILLCFSCNDAEKLFDVWFCICSWSINWYHTICEHLGKKGLELLIFYWSYYYDLFEEWYRGAFFAWCAPILSSLRIMCSQVRMLKFLEPSREMP